jgi:hypothetical protein
MELRYCSEALTNPIEVLIAVRPLAFLAPDIVDAVAAGRQPANMTAHRLIRSMELPIGWGAQKQLLGFS